MKINKFRRFLVLIKSNFFVLLFLPYIVIHEFSHYFFIWLAGESKGVTVDIQLNSITINMPPFFAKRTPIYLTLYLLMPMAPMICFIMNYAILYIFPSLNIFLALYVSIGGWFLLPSSLDIMMFIKVIDFIKHPEKYRINKDLED